MFALAIEPRNIRGTFMSKLLDALKTVASWLYGLTASDGSLRNYINPAELVRVVLPALLHGGGVYAILTAILGSAGTIFSASSLGVAVAVLTALVQVVRMFEQGEPAPTPAPSPAQDPSAGAIAAQ
jgi:hypothetical protein